MSHIINYILEIYSKSQQLVFLILFLWMSNFIDQNIWRQQLQTEQGSLQLQHSKYQIQQSSLLHYKQPHKKWVKDFIPTLSSSIKWINGPSRVLTLITVQGTDKQIDKVQTQTKTVEDIFHLLHITCYKGYNRIRAKALLYNYKLNINLYCYYHKLGHACSTIARGDGSNLD